MRGGRLRRRAPRRANPTTNGRTSSAIEWWSTKNGRSHRLRLFAPRVFRRDEGKHYCEALTLAGRDWRLPTAAELRTIAVRDTYGGEAAIDLSIFPRTPPAAFWSARPQLTGDARLSADCHAGLVALLDLFDENERLYIHYRRDTEGRVWQESYELSRHRNKAKLVEERAYIPARRAQARARRRREAAAVLIRRHRNELAVAFAQRAMLQIEDVVTTIERMYVPDGAELPVV